MDVLVFVVLLLQGSHLLLASNHDDDCMRRSEVQLILRNIEAKHEEAILSLKEEITVLKRDKPKYEAELGSLRELTNSLLNKLHDAIGSDSDTEGVAMADTITKAFLSVQRNVGRASVPKARSILVGDTGIKRFVVADGAVEQGVAFSVAIGTTGREHLGQGQTIIFDHIISNVGNAFDANISVFQVPVTGWYVFSLTLMSRPNEWEQLNVMRNRVEVFHCYCDGNEYNSASRTVVVQAEQGDDIWVEALYPNSNAHGLNHTSFTGFLLYPA